mgnify:CR=1 FL=1
MDSFRIAIRGKAIRELMMTCGVGHRLTVRGKSMAPSLSCGQAISVYPIRGKLRAGDLYVYSNGEALVIHRYVRKRGKKAIMWGDANRSFECIESDQLIGWCKVKESSSQRFTVRWVNYIAASTSIWAIKSMRTYVYKRLLKGVDDEKKI